MCSRNRKVANADPITPVVRMLPMLGWKIEEEEPALPIRRE
jgi:hypothetical protein